MTAVLAPPAGRFLPATEPPEARGLQRDEVRLLVASADGTRHTLFRDLPSTLEPGDLVVVNTSATLAAALDGRRHDGTSVKIHVSGPLPGGSVVVEIRRTGHGRVRDIEPGEVIHVAGGATVVLLTSYPEGGTRLWHACVDGAPDFASLLEQYGRPIAYDYLAGAWPLAAYQTIFARDPGSAEMPSAGRPFSPRVLALLAQRGVLVAPITLHTGVSSLEAGELPLPERYVVPASTARTVNDTRRGGGRIVAVGTTVARALETAVDSEGIVRAAAGWTELVLSPERPPRVVDGLVTGWHEPDASHLLLLEAVAGRDMVTAAYAAAAAEGYRWHEFGDSCLLLP